MNCKCGEKEMDCLATDTLDEVTIYHCLTCGEVMLHWWGKGLIEWRTHARVHPVVG